MSLPSSTFLRRQQTEVRCGSTSEVQPKQVDQRGLRGHREGCDGTAYHHAPSGEQHNVFSGDLLLFAWELTPKCSKGDGCAVQRGGVVSADLTTGSVATAPRESINRDEAGHSSDGGVAARGRT